jgi:protein-disulfide isomerase-like protein with CxxC motif
VAGSLPFTWGKLESMHGPIRPAEIRRIKAFLSDPKPATWRRARSIVVAGHMGMRCSTLWQCVEAITLKRFPDGYVPDYWEVIRGLCYATGEPYIK